MARLVSRAFTLVELIIVIAIIGILIALLMPGLTTVWGVSAMTQCSTNLATLYKAQSNWNADRDATQSTLNAGWAGSLKTYLEGRTDALQCPSAAIASIGIGDNTTPGSTGTTGGGGDTGDSTYNDYSDAPVEPDLQIQDVTIGVLDANKNLVCEIPLAPSPVWSWYQSWTLPDGRTQVQANLDNDMRKNAQGIYIDNDFDFVVEFRGSSPIKIQIGPCDGSANIAHGKWSDLRIDHKPIWGGEVFGNLFAAGHVGEVVDVQKEIEKQSGGKKMGTRRRAAYTTWTIMSTSKAILGATSYGLNRGSFQMQDDLNPAGRDVPRPDPKLIFILDYPKAIADMTDIGDTLGERSFFDQIFIDPTPPDDWMAPPGLEGRAWAESQALRHFGRANVLFCDGHIESMEKADLNPNLDRIRNSIWNYQGK
ncbi:MAG: prepilin-type N-terminal cleavage/methylation domain-containing protein [Planctomycetota bacterium]|nr:prepilin-type N-terminal cleavage/methylation domain-containing protein [Planctomycetota bacterium]